MSPACDVRIPPPALQHKSQLVAFPGELWLESTKSASFLLEGSGSHRGNCFAFSIRASRLGCRSAHGARQPEHGVVFFSVQLAKVCLVVERTRVRPGWSCGQAWKGDNPVTGLEHCGRRGPEESLPRAEVSQPESDLLLSGDLGLAALCAGATRRKVPLAGTAAGAEGAAGGTQPSSQAPSQAPAGAVWWGGQALLLAQAVFCLGSACWVPVRRESGSSSLLSSKPRGTGVASPAPAHGGLSRGSARCPRWERQREGVRMMRERGDALCLRTRGSGERLECGVSARPGRERIAHGGAVARCAFPFASVTGRGLAGSCTGRSQPGERWLSLPPLLWCYAELLSCERQLLFR